MDRAEEKRWRQLCPGSAENEYSGQTDVQQWQQGLDEKIKGKQTGKTFSQVQDEVVKIGSTDMDHWLGDPTDKEPREEDYLKLVGNSRCKQTQNV